MYAATLKKHPVMLALDSQDAAILGSICHAAMLDEFCLVDEDIWSHGAAATKMHFVVSGKLECFPEATMSVNKRQSSPVNADAKAGDILCEQALWLVWHHSGYMSTTTDVLMFTLSAKKFGEIVRCSVGVKFAFIYVRNFHEEAMNGETGITCNLTRAHDLVKRSLQELQPDVQRVPSSNTPSRMNRLIRARTQG